MANRSFHHLLAELNITGSTEAGELVEALYLIRAHRSLAAIIPVARRFIDLAKTHPELWALGERVKGGAGLRLLERVAYLATGDPLLTGAEVGSDNSLRPVSGDSCITDLLLDRLIPPRRWVS